MIIHLAGRKHPVRALLDTGCSVPLINEETTRKMGVECRKHSQVHTVEDYTGKKVSGASQYFTMPLLLQHRKHYGREVFVMSPMDQKIDIFLPFEWIRNHPPQGAWTNEEIRFNSPKCLENCDKYSANQFSLTWDDTVATDQTAGLLGHVSAVTSEDSAQAVPVEFRQYLGIMGKDAADALPEHRPYDCKIDLKEGATAPWGPFTHSRK